jgi:hypothetical protein
MTLYNQDNLDQDNLDGSKNGNRAA